MWIFSKKSNASNRLNKRAQARRSPVYTVHARASGRRNDSMHMAGAIALLIIAAGGVVWLLMAGTSSLRRVLFVQNEQFVIRNIETASSGRLTKDHIKEFGGFYEGLNLFELDLRAVRKKLMDVPTIKSAEVQRKLPSTLVVKVSERIPLARVSPGQVGFFFSIDRDAHVLGLAGQTLKHLPVITGFSDRGVAPGSVLNDAALTDALGLLALLDEAQLSQDIKVSSVSVSNPEYLDVSLDAGVKVLMPRQVSRTKLEDLALILRQSGGRQKVFDLTLDRNIPAT